ncbi:MAG: TrbG/VirB9 family P-type conjugative transfer protein [Erythrobacter sp.]
MRWLMALLALVGVCMPATAQVLPTPSYDNPRLQTVRYQQDQQVVLTVLPQTALTVLLSPNEEITRIIAGDRQSFDVKVTSERNGFQITPRNAPRDMSLTVETKLRGYEFTVTVGDGLMAAYLVRFEYGPTAPPPVPDEILGLDDGALAQNWTYRLRGSREVRPLEISDDGRKTHIRYSDAQALPAVFAIGPTGKEELVNGYMRDGVYVIDRVYEELVFRIDKKKARALRRDAPEAAL